MALFTNIRKSILMRRARRLYEAYDAILDEYDCGINMAMVMSPRLRWTALAFNKTLDQLALLDPTCPSERLPT